jgi:cytochrome c oxidase subunit 2
VSRVRGRLALLGVIVAAAAGGCYPTPATAQGREISDLYRTFFAASIVVALIVWGLATVVILRYRRRGDAVPRQVHGNNRLELIWTAIPLLTVLALFALTYQTINSVDAKSSEPGVDVHVTAFRWSWRFDYPGRNVTITGTVEQPPELVVPVDQPVHVTLDSPDVAHAFFVPAFLFKRDAIPGITNQFDFRVETPGTYPGQCAEFCGAFHSRMTFTVRAVSATEFDQWLAQQAAAG